MIARREKLMMMSPSYARLRREEEGLPVSGGGGHGGSSSPKKGFVPVLVGNSCCNKKKNKNQKEEEIERIEIPIKLINHPSVISLLDFSVQEFGHYNPHGVLRVSCDVQRFKEIVRTLLISTKK